MQESSTKSEKPTSEGCMTAAIAILGDKWTARLIQALAQHNMRFTQLQQSAGGVNPRTLSARLAHLEAMGVITKTTISTMPPHTEYALTQKGRDLLPILERMIAWGAKYAPIGGQC